MRMNYLLYALLLGLAACDHQPGVPTMTVDYNNLYVPPGYTLAPFVSAAPVHSFSAAGQGVEAGKSYEVLFVTDAGNIELALSAADAPLAVNSMVWLARNHFYDGIAFHRVIEDFVAQAGDPNTLTAESPSWGTGGCGYTFALEVATGRGFDGAGVLGMARGDATDSNGSQFFITLTAQPTLNGQYTVFGNVVSGGATLSAIRRGEPPSSPTRITVAYAVYR
ncbi:MAG: peptidylprolyl isomerase [Polyangia bacterium]